ncbi:MAG: hypothetical protein K0S26_1770 [Bacteroidota bacterium]|nr:hypothetical protein [Bacteroidota bacterium]
MNILIYHPTNLPAKDLESLMYVFIEKKHTVFLLTHEEKGKLHENSEKLGVHSFSVGAEVKKSFLKQVQFLVAFCKRNKIDVAYSNLQQSSKISILVQYFTKTRFIIYRHHSDSVYLYGSRKEKLLDRLINRFARKIIVISEFSRRQIIEVEKADPEKVENSIQVF